MALHAQVLCARSVLYEEPDRSPGFCGSLVNPLHPRKHLCLTAVLFICRGGAPTCRLAGLGRCVGCADESFKRTMNCAEWRLSLVPSEGAVCLGCLFTLWSCHMHTGAGKGVSMVTRLLQHGKFGVDHKSSCLLLQVAKLGRCLLEEMG